MAPVAAAVAFWNRPEVCEVTIRIGTASETKVALADSDHAMNLGTDC